MNITAICFRVALISSALIGGIISTLADLIQKEEASAVLSIDQKLHEILFIPSTGLYAIALVLFLGVAISLIFKATTPKDAFYLGAGVLALIVTMTPYKLSPGFKGEPNSVEVNLTISRQDKQPVNDAVVTLFDASGRTVISRAKLPGSQLKFYQGGGAYRLTVELSGYKTDSRDLILTEGSRPQTILITLQPSSAPLFLQRITR